MTDLEKAMKRIEALEKVLRNKVKAEKVVHTTTNQSSSAGVEENPEDVLNDEIAYMSINAIQGRRTQRQLQRLAEIGVLEQAAEKGSAYQKRYARSQLRWMAR
jgi:hypothetical protein